MSNISEPNRTKVRDAAGICGGKLLETLRRVVHERNARRVEIKQGKRIAALLATTGVQNQACGMSGIGAFVALPKVVRIASNKLTRNCNPGY